MRCISNSKGVFNDKSKLYNAAPLALNLRLCITAARSSVVPKGRQVSNGMETGRFPDPAIVRIASVVLIRGWYWC